MPYLARSGAVLIPMVEGFSKDWVCVYVGLPSMAELLGQVLEAEGIATHVPDRYLRLIDPGAIGGPNQLQGRVFVPREHEARAREIVARDPDAS